jgi:hypothetical protein
MANDSSDHRKDFVQVGDTLTVFKTIRQNSQRESLNSNDRFLTSLSINHDAGEGRNLRNPTSIFFLIKLDWQIHGILVTK